MVTIGADVTVEEEIRKSRFIAHAARCDDEAAALAFLKAIAAPKANHNCWAYAIGDLKRFSDDGEPGGTAGRPILAAIEAHELDHVMVVVTRYFGGIKLGAGGLVRAYGGVAGRCLADAPRVTEIQPVALHVELPYEQVAQVFALLDGGRGAIDRQDYGADGMAHLEAQIAPEHLGSFEKALINASRGQATIKIIDEPRPPDRRRG